MAFEQTGLFEVIYANEKDKEAVVTYEMNSSLKVDTRSIEDVLPEEIPDFDIALAGFPCNDISLAGIKQGLYEEDGSYTRSGMLFEFIRIIHEKKPRILFLENVRYLLKHDGGKTMQIVLDAIKQEGYYYKYDILNASKYGNTPQNRTRVYIVCSLYKEDIDRFSFPKPIKRTNTLENVIDYYGKYTDRYYITRKYKDGIYDSLLEVADGSHNVYMNDNGRAAKCIKGTIPALVASKSNIPIVQTEHGFRHMMPCEYFVAQTFPENFIIPPQLHNCALYKQAGNSVCITVVRRVAEQIAEAIS